MPFFGLMPTMFGKMVFFSHVNMPHGSSHVIHSFQILVSYESYPDFGTDSKCSVAPRIKALSNEVNKRFNDLESQMHKTNFDAASVFARLDSVEAEPLRFLAGSGKKDVLFTDLFG